MARGHMSFDPSCCWEQLHRNAAAFMPGSIWVAGLFLTTQVWPCPHVSTPYIHFKGKLSVLDGILAQGERLEILKSM